MAKRSKSNGFQIWLILVLLVAAYWYLNGQQPFFNEITKPLLIFSGAICAFSSVMIYGQTRQPLWGIAGGAMVYVFTLYVSFGL
jgi:hypothetical protein